MGTTATRVAIHAEDPGGRIVGGVADEPDGYSQRGRRPSLGVGVGAGSLVLRDGVEDGSQDHDEPREERNQGDRVVHQDERPHGAIDGGGDGDDSERSPRGQPVRRDAVRFEVVRGEEEHGRDERGDGRQAHPVREEVREVGSPDPEGEQGDQPVVLHQRARRVGYARCGHVESIEVRVLRPFPSQGL